MSSRRSALLLVLAALPLVGQRAVAQRLSATASVSVQLRVMPVASFEGGATHDFVTELQPGVARVIDPADGVRTRLTYNTATRVVVTGTPLRGPDGSLVVAHFTCARGAEGATLTSERFDCAAGFVAPVSGRAATIPLAVGASIDAPAGGTPAGLYRGQVTFVASAPGY